MSAARRPWAWLLNLDAELELTNPGHFPSARLAAQLERYRALARALLAPDDVEIADQRRCAESLPGRAWCPTPSALAALRRAGATPEPHPALAVLQRVNHRRFAVELGAGLPQQRYVTSRAELERVLDSAPRAWLLKRPLAFAGRGQLRWFGAGDARQASWIDASLARDGLVVEPLVTPLLELSLHGFIRKDGEYELGRICVQDVSPHGVARGVRLASAGELRVDEAKALFAVAERVASALIGAEYFGPFGVDAFRYQAGAEVGFCALSELNARYTIGFVVGFPRPPAELVL